MTSTLILSSFDSYLHVQSLCGWVGGKNCQKWQTNKDNAFNACLKLPDPFPGPSSVLENIFH